jgi:hypothetical protein
MGFCFLFDGEFPIRFAFTNPSKVSIERIPGITQLTQALSHNSVN